MLPSTQQEFSKDSSFGLFPQLPAEIRNYIWKISVEDYPARIIDLREYRQPASRTLSPETPSTLKCLTESSSGDFHDPKNTDDTREIAGFKSRVPAPTVLYICRDSRDIAQESYTKAFGTADMPAEIWIDFNKDILYVSIDFCLVALEGFEFSEFFHYRTGRKEPHGYFLKELSQEILKVKDLAIGGSWYLGPYVGGRYHHLSNVYMLTKFFKNLERVTLVDIEHAPDVTADLVIADVPDLSAEAQDPDYGDYKDFVVVVFGDACWNGKDVYFGRISFPWFEFGTMVERPQDCIAPSTRPRTSGSRWATEEDHEWSVSDPAIWAWLLEGVPEAEG